MNEQRYTVMVDDNFHYMDEEHRYEIGTFASYEAAVEACKKIVDEELPGHSDIAAVSGPSFAKEVARGLPTAVTVASKNADYATRVAELLHSPRFRAYTCEDVIGVELGGSSKNVLAIAAGISDGLGYGANARAALITRGLAEIMRLGTCLGGQRETFMGLAGVGDLVLTCTGDLSRNRTVGLKLGQGKSLQEILENEKTVAEGVRTTRSVYDLSRKYKIEMPITHQVFRILYEGARPRDAVYELMSRSPREETDAFGDGSRKEWN